MCLSFIEKADRNKNYVQNANVQLLKTFYRMFLSFISLEILNFKGILIQFWKSPYIFKFIKR